MTGGGEQTSKAGNLPETPQKEKPGKTKVIHSLRVLCVNFSAIQRIAIKPMLNF